MTMDELEEEIVRVRLQSHVLRDAIVWLLARELGRSREPEATLRLLGEYLEIRASTPASPTTEDLRVSDVYHEEIDWIVGAISQGLRRSGS